MSIYAKEGQEKICPFANRVCAEGACLAWQAKSNGLGVCLRMVEVLMRLKRDRPGQ